MNKKTVVSLIVLSIALLLISGCGEFAGQAMFKMISKHTCVVRGTSHCEGDMLVTNEWDAKCKVTTTNEDCAASGTRCWDSDGAGSCLTPAEYEAAKAGKLITGGGSGTGTITGPSGETGDYPAAGHLRFEDVALPNFRVGQKYNQYIDHPSCDSSCVWTVTDVKELNYARTWVERVDLNPAQTRPMLPLGISFESITGSAHLYHPPQAHAIPASKWQTNKPKSFKITLQVKKAGSVLGTKEFSVNLVN